jgi:hypothetical protein
MLQNNITNEKLIEQMLQNLKKNSGENRNLPFKKQLCVIIDGMLKESEHFGCFCYLITLNIKEKKEINKALEIIQNLTDIAFYTFALERLNNDQLRTHIFLAIRNLIGNNSCIENNIRGRFLYEQIFDTEITECKTFLDKIKTFQYVIKGIFLSDAKVLFGYNSH